jgi:riboflavin kinase/FMN adenylyltransferase
VEILEGVDSIPSGLRFVATLGVFDGVHVGHRVVLDETIRAARTLGAASVVITFRPHPEAVLRGRAPAVVCDPIEKAARIAGEGIDILAIQSFDHAFSEQSAEAFVDRLRTGRDLAGLVMSSESAFGHDRAGTTATLRRLADTEGWTLAEVPTLERGHERVSSGRIRALVEEGSLGAAARLLGRPYAVIGEVVHGDARGRELGFPTANLYFAHEVALPPNGIYAVRVGWGGEDPLEPLHRADGVASLGVRPTFGEGRRLLEVYLLDFDGDLYGQRLRVEFVRRQRGEKRFNSVEALIVQMGSDVDRARTILRGTNVPATNRSATSESPLPSTAHQG